MALVNETDKQFTDRMLTWASTAAPARSDDTSVLAGRRLTRDDVVAYLAQLDADRHAGITDRDWTAWVTQLPPRSI